MRVSFMSFSSLIPLPYLIIQQYQDSQMFCLFVCFLKGLYVTCPGSHGVDQAGFEHTKIHLASKKVSTTCPGSETSFEE